VVTSIDVTSNLSPARHRVLLVDNRCIVRQGLSTLIERFADLVVVGQLPDSKTALDQAREIEPDVIVLSVHGPDDANLGTIRDLHRAYPTARVMVLGAGDDETELVYHAVRAGALGYVSQDSEIQDLVKAIRHVAQGQATLGPRPLARLLQKIAEVEQPEPQSLPRHLSDREREVLRLVAEGRSNREIADALYLSESTVRSHIHNIFAKLQLTNRVQAARLVLDNRG